MERHDGSGSETSTENETLQEGKVCFNINHELSNILSEVRMMSDSLAASSRMSKHRTFRKVVKMNDRVSTQSSVQILLPAKNGNHCDVGKNIIASFVMKVNQKKKEPERNTCEGREEFMPKSNLDEGLTKSLGNSFTRKRESLYADRGKGREIRMGSSRVLMYKPGSVIPERMIDVIQRELKTLMKLSPSLAYLLVTMSDTMFHYKSCFKCRNNIHHTFPWILNKLQKLIKYIITKRQGIYIWPNDYSYLRLVPDEQTAHKREDKDDFECENIESLPDQKSSSSPPEEQEVRLGKLEKVDPSVVSESFPGVQLFLQVKPRQSKKRFFRRVSKKFRYNSSGKFPVVQLKETSDIPIYVILRHRPVFEVRLTEKRVVSRPNLISCRSLLKFKFPSLTSYLIFYPVTWGRIHRQKEEVVYLRQLQLTDQADKANTKSNARISYFTKNILMNFSELVFDFLAEGEEEKMQMQIVRELEAEVKELRSLMLDVRRNQADLSKVLNKKHISSLPFLRFTSPEMLQEEDWVVNQISEIKLHKTTTSSLEALQSTLGDLKRKCNLKNRLILTMLKGFESNVPKEWWTEIMSLMFGDSLEEDNLTAENVGGCIRKTLFFLRNGEQVSTTLLPLTGFDEKLSKEEPIMKGKMGADVEDNLKILSELDDKYAKIVEDTLLPLDCQFPMSIFAYPAVLQENFNSSLRRLEYQVSILNVENERLWHEILDLKGTLKSSLKKFGQKISHHASEEPSVEISKTNGKTINIKIQVASDKKHRISTDSGAKKIAKENETSKSSDSGAPKLSALSKSTNDNYFSILKEKTNYGDYEEAMQSKKIAVLATGLKTPLRAESLQSNSDINYLEDLIPSSSVSSYREKEEKIKALLLGRPSTPSKEQVFTANTHLFEQGPRKKIQPVPSMHVVSEATTNYLAGPSRRQLDDDYYLQSPSEKEPSEGQSGRELLLNERELHPIPEDGVDLDPESSGSINEAIQHLRGRVRSIHKDVQVLKSKNDRIDKVLSRLMDDMKNNNESFEEIQKTLNLKE